MQKYRPRYSAAGIFAIITSMKYLLGPLDSRVETALLILLVSLLLLLAPWFYGSLVSFFALLDQYILFNMAVAVALAGIAFYTVLQSKKVLGIPYAISASLLGLAGYKFFSLIFDLPENTYLVLGTAAAALVFFRRGLSVDIVGSRKTFWKSITVGALAALVFFLIANYLIGLVFPGMDETLRYSICTIFLMMGGHLHNTRLVSMETVRFSFDMTLLVILYNFLLFSSRLLPGGFASLASHLPVYTSAIASTVYGILIGLIGAYLLHRHHAMWSGQTNERHQNIYTITLLAGVLALSFLFGANPFVAAGVMGLLVTIRDNKENPEDRILNRAESIITIVAYLIIASSISVSLFSWLLSFGSVTALFVTLFSVFILATLLNVASHWHLLPHAKWNSYIVEVLKREDAPAIIGSLVLFSMAYVGEEGPLLAALSLVFMVVISYVYPWVLRLLKEDALDSR